MEHLFYYLLRRNLVEPLMDYKRIEEYHEDIINKQKWVEATDTEVEILRTKRAYSNT